VSGEAERQMGQEGPASIVGRRSDGGLCFFAFVVSSQWIAVGVVVIAYAP